MLHANEVECHYILRSFGIQLSAQTYYTGKQHHAYATLMYGIYLSVFVQQESKYSKCEEQNFNTHTRGRKQTHNSYKTYRVKMWRTVYCTRKGVEEMK